MRRRCGDTDCTANISLGCSGQHARTERLLSGVSVQREERFADCASYFRAATV